MFPAFSVHEELDEYNRIIDRFPLKRVTQQNSFIFTEWINRLSYQKPVMLIFLRHSGCMFCEKTLIDLEEHIDLIRAADAFPVVIHMGLNRNKKILARVGDMNVLSVESSDHYLYDHYNIPRKAVRSLFHLSALKAIGSLLMQGLRPGKIQGDIHRLPGMLIFKHGRQIYAHRYHCMSEATPYKEICINWFAN